LMRKSDMGSAFSGSQNKVFSSVKYRV